MYNVENRTKTSLFLVMLMILTPFAAASSITTFSDGSSQVEIEFKDGDNILNTIFCASNGTMVISASDNRLKALESN